MLFPTGAEGPGRPSPAGGLGRPGAAPQHWAVLRDLGSEGEIMTVVTTIAGIAALVAMGYLAALLLRGGDR